MPMKQFHSFYRGYLPQLHVPLRCCDAVMLLCCTRMHLNDFRESCHHLCRNNRKSKTARKTPAYKFLNRVKVNYPSHSCSLALSPCSLLPRTYRIMGFAWPFFIFHYNFTVRRITIRPSIPSSSTVPTSATSTGVCGCGCMSTQFDIMF